MPIRQATLKDSSAIQILLDQLDYPTTDPFLQGKMERILHQPNSVLFVYEQQGSVLAFMALDFITQLGLEGDFARISYFAVDQSARGRHIGREMEAYAEHLARERHCDRIELHCHERRIDALRFYRRQGYTESPHYLIKLV